LQDKEEVVMAHPILLGLLGGLVVTRLVMRARHRRAFAGGCGGRFGRFSRGPMDLGAPDRERHFGRWGRRWGRFAPNDDAARAPVDVKGSLELNARQKELYDEVVGKAKASLGAESLAEALAAVGREPYDRAEVETIVQKQELVYDLEHLHHSLTPEQRAKLRQVTSA
jgi:hypothetical protein